MSILHTASPRPTSARLSRRANRPVAAFFNRRAATALAVGSLLALGLHPAQAGNDAWSTAPASANFSGINWTTGATIPGTATGTITTGDVLYFGTSSMTTLNNDETAGFSLGGFNFNTGAAAFTIGGNSFALNGNITNNSTNLQTINDAFSMAAMQTFTTLTGGGNLTFDGVISGAGGLITTGSGTTTLFTDNTFTGGTIVNGGTLALNKSGSAGTVRGVVTVNSGATLNLTVGDAIGYNSDGTQVTTLNIIGGTVDNTTSGNEGYSTNVSLTGGTLKSSGGGLFRFNNATAGSFGVTSNASAITSTISTNIDAFNGPLNFNVASGTTASGTDLLVSGAIISNSITKTGAGNLQLSNAANSFTGNVSITGGTLTASSGGNNGGTTDLGSDGAANRTITVGNGTANSGILSLTTNNIFGSGQASSANIPSLIINSGGLVTSTRYNVLGAVTLNGGTLTQNSTDTGNYQGYQFLGSVTVGGTSASTISNKYNGGTNNAGDHLGSNTQFTVASTGAAGPDLTVSAPLVNQSGDFNNNTGGLTKLGGGTMSLTAANTYTGATAVNGGTLALGSGGSLAATAVTVGNTGTFAVTPGVAGATNTLAGSLTLNSGSAYTMEDGQINTFNVAGASALAPATAGVAPLLSFDLSGTNGVTDLLNFTGGATDATNVSVAFDALGALTTGNTYTFLTATSGLIPANFTLGATRVTYGNTAYNLTLSGNGTSETVTIGNSGIPTVYYDGYGGTSALNAVTAGKTNFSIDTAGATDAGGQPSLLSDVNFTATNVTTPQTIASLGQSYNVNSVNFLSGAPAITLNAGGGAGQTLTVNGGGITDASANNQTLNVPVLLGTVSQSFSNTGTGILALGGTVSNGGFNLTTAGTGAIKISGVISGTGGLINTNTGTVTLTGANTYTGGTTINAGTLQLGDGATNNGSVTGNITDNAALTFADPSAQTYAGSISGNGTVTKTSAGTLTLTGASTDTGATTINAGTLQLGDGATTNGSVTGNITDNAALTFADPNAQTYAGSISGNGTVTKTSAGTLTLSNGGSSFTGNVTITGGTLTVSGGGTNAGNTALGSDATTPRTITIGSGATLNLAINDVFGNATTTNVPTITVNGGTVSSTRYNAIGNIILNGGTLSQNSTDGTGPTSAFQGYQFLGNVTVGGTSASTISNGATNVGDQLASNTTFNVGVTGAAGPDLIVSSSLANTSPSLTAAGLTKTGAGTMVLTATNTYSGGTTVNGGTLALGASGADGSGSLTVNSGGTVTVTANNAVNNTGAVKLNGGTLLNADTSANGTGGLNSSTAPTNNTQNLGVLTVGANSVLDFGAGNSGAIFDFANSSLATWTGTLSVYDWAGNYPTGAYVNDGPGTTGGDGKDELFFGTDTTGLTSTQLGDIKFYSDQGSTLLGGGVNTILADGEVSPAPEPAQWATLSMIGLGLGGLLLRARKRLQTMKGA